MGRASAFVRDELQQRAVRVAAVDARPTAAGDLALDRPDLDLHAVAAEVLDRASIGPGQTRQRSLLPGRTRSRAASSGCQPGPWTFSCWSPKR